MRPTRAALIGLLIGAAVAMAAAVGPLLSATLITIGVETQVGTATGLPNASMLPASLEGLGAVALVYIITVRPAGAMRWWCVALIGATLGAGMAAQGSHALWFDERTQVLALPWRVKLFVSFLPPASGAAALHLVVKMAEGLIVTVRQLQALPPEPRVVESTPVPAPAPEPIPQVVPAGVLASSAEDVVEPVREQQPEPSASTASALPAGIPAEAGADDREQAPNVSADTSASDSGAGPVPPPDGRPRGGRRARPKPAAKPARGHVREQAARLPKAEVLALVQSAREHVLADPDRPGDRALDEAIAEHLADGKCLSCGVHPLSRSRVRTYLAELRRESADGPAPARRPRVVHLEAAPAAASDHAQEA
jgi:hypothetical protein